MVRKTHPTLLNNAPPALYVIGSQVVQVCAIRATGIGLTITGCPDRAQMRRLGTDYISYHPR